MDKIVLYAEDRKGNIFENKTVYTVGFTKANAMSNAYLHGKLEKKNGFDLVYTDNRDLIIQEGIYDVDVIFSDGTKESAKLFYWEGKDNNWRGLVCALDDKEAQEYAQKKFEEKPWHI